MTYNLIYSQNSFILPKLLIIHFLTDLSKSKSKHINAFLSCQKETTARKKGRSVDDNNNNALYYSVKSSSKATLSSLIGDTDHNTGISLLLSTSVWALLSPPIERWETRPTA